MIDIPPPDSLVYGLPGLEGDVVHGEEVRGPGARAHLEVLAVHQQVRLVISVVEMLSHHHIYHSTLVHKPQPEEILVSEVVQLVGVFITNLVQVFPP